MNAFLARLVAFFSGQHVGETLHGLSAKAETDYQAAITAAHDALRVAKHDLGEVALTELELLEKLIDTAKRRAAALADADVLPEQHTARLDKAIRKVVA
jgi:hypothetical protein